MKIWRDKIDKDAYHVGVGETWWFTVYEDGLLEIFGEIIYHKATKSSFADGPIEIKLYTQDDITESVQQEREDCAMIASNWGGVGEQVAKEIRERK